MKTCDHMSSHDKNASGKLFYHADGPEKQLILFVYNVLLFAGLSCIFSDCSALSCIFSLRPVFFSHLKNGLFVKSLQLVTRLMV